MKLLLTAILPMSVFASVSGYFLANTWGVSAESVITLVSLVALGAAMVLERYVPFEAKWNVPMSDSVTDWTSFAVLAGMVQPLLKWVSPLLLIVVFGEAQLSANVMLTEIPFALQVLVVTLVAEFGKYWVHRLHHRFASLWWLHSLHHSSKRLYALNNFRVHPLEYGIKHVLAIVPLLMLGVPAQVLLAYIAITQPIQMLQHVNVNLQLGWLNYIFSTNELHRWHHSADASQSECNFGSALVIWDQVFGTFHYPKGEALPVKVGLYTGSKYPGGKSYLQQLGTLFAPVCCKT